MKFLSVRELRIAPGRVWKELPEEKEIIVTSNGKPIALLTPASGDNLEEALANLRRAKGMAALERIQASSLKRGLDTLTTREIQREIAQSRRARTSGRGRRP